MMNLQRLKLSQLRALVAVADYSNFSEAALILGLSQSTVSHAIASLETELGVILLNRGRYGANLTPVGERIVAHVRQVQNLVEQIGVEANREKGLQGGEIRIASFRSIATHILPTVIARLHRHYPNVQVILTEMDDLPEIEQALRGGDADICFTYLPAAKDFETWEIIRDDYIAVFPATHSTDQTQLTWQELATQPLILSTVGCCANLIYKYLKTAPSPVNVAYQVRQDSTIISMVMQGLGVGILPRLAAEPLPETAIIRQLPSHLERVIGVAILKDKIYSPAVFAFLDALRQVGQFQQPQASSV
ncbi:MAG: LysR family transcriptional regulator [Microcoleaceae cyanobacterium]